MQRGSVTISEPAGGGVSFWLPGSFASLAAVPRRRRDGQRPPPTITLRSRRAAILHRDFSVAPGVAPDSATPAGMTMPGATASAYVPLPVESKVLDCVRVDHPVLHPECSSIGQ